MPCRNYVIQSILNHGIEWATSKIVDELEGHFGYLSVQKCGSHVVENCLKRAPQHMRDKIIQELINDPKLQDIMVDWYDNFVIQTALERCKVKTLIHPKPKSINSYQGCLVLQGTVHTTFVEAIRPHAAAMQSTHVWEKGSIKNIPQEQATPSGSFVAIHACTRKTSQCSTPQSQNKCR